MDDEKKRGPLNVGDKFLKKYQVVSLLGRGGYAFVYECVDLFLGRPVALKIFKPVSGPADVERQAQKEAKALLMVSDDRLVKLLDAGTHDGLVYLVMEKLNGRTLRDVLQEVGRLTVPEGLHIMLQAARGLAAAHRAGVIHRDVKPENIFIEAHLSAKLLDLGIAKVQGLGAQTTHRDGVRGTILYMAPEQLLGHGATPRSDIYSLGVVGFEMFFRHFLYLGEGPPAYDHAAWQQISFVPPMLDELDSDIPHDVAKLVRRLLIKAPEQRYDSMDRVIELLVEIIRRLQADWGPQGKFILRELHVPRPEERVPSVEEAARPPIAVSQQLTVKDRQIPGDTAPFSKQPFSDPGAPTAFAVSSPASASPRASAPASDRQKAPSSAEKPTVWTARKEQASSRSSPVIATTIGQTTTAPLKPSSPPRSEEPAAASAPLSVAASDSPRDVIRPSTPPPVAARVRARAATVQPSFFSDPSLRRAGVAACILGIVVGAAIGWFKFLRAPAATESAVQLAVPSAQAPEPAPSPVATNPAEKAPVVAAAAPAASAASTPPTPAPRPTTASAAPAPAPRSDSKSAAPAKPRDPLIPSDEEVKRRMNLLRSGLDPEPTPPVAAPSAPPRPQRHVQPPDTIF